MRHLFMCALAASLLGGCLGHRRVGHFGDGAYYHQRDHYRIRYSAGDGRELLPEGWALQNYLRDEEGRPTFARRDVMQVLDTRSFTGRGRGGVFALPATDLLYRVEGGDGEIWVRTVPLPVGWSSAPLSQVLHGAIAALARPGIAAPEVRPVSSPLTHVEVLTWGEAQVDGRRAFWVESDVHDHMGTTQRMTVLAVRTSMDRPYRQGRRIRAPIMLVIGHRSSPEAHEDQRSVFASLVRRVDIHR